MGGFIGCVFAYRWGSAGYVPFLCLAGVLVCFCAFCVGSPLRVGYRGWFFMGCFRGSFLFYGGFGVRAGLPYTAGAWGAKNAPQKK